MLPLVRFVAVAALLLLASESSAFVHIGNGVASKWGDDTAVGTGAVVTWGFIPDGTVFDDDFVLDSFTFPDTPGVVGGSRVGQLRSLIDGNHGAGEFDAAIRRAFATWEAVADITFVEVTDPGGDVGAFTSTTPDIRIGAFAPDTVFYDNGDGQTAQHWFNFTGAIGIGPPGFRTPEFPFPESGEILFNLNGNPFGGAQTPFHIAAGDEDVTPVDFFNFGDDLEGLFLHELGHAAIGLAHPPWDGEDPDRRVMYVGDFANEDAPFCCTAINRELHPDDIAGARFVYGLKGDYNQDGAVDAADYTVWRDARGLTGEGLAADADRDGNVDIDDYHAWRNNYGAVEVTSQTFVGAAPEPSALALAALLPLVGRRLRAKCSSVFSRGDGCPAVLRGIDRNTRSENA